jgi:hypothetical protein
MRATKPPHRMPSRTFTVTGFDSASAVRIYHRFAVLSPTVSRIGWSQSRLMFRCESGLPLRDANSSLLGFLPATYCRRIAAKDSGTSTSRMPFLVFGVLNLFVYTLCQTCRMRQSSENVVPCWHFRGLSALQCGQPTLSRTFIARASPIRKPNPPTMRESMYVTFSGFRTALSNATSRICVICSGVHASEFCSSTSTIGKSM